MVGRVRALVLLPLLAAPAFASAERLLYIPTARKIPLGQLHYEFRHDPSRSLTEHYFRAAVTHSIELEIRSQPWGTRSSEVGVDLTYNYIVPLVGFTPGFAFGVQDAADQTADGRRLFFAVTFREGFFVEGGEELGEATLGISHFQGRIQPFVGASIPLSQRLRILAEHDGLRVNAGVELRVIPQASIRAMMRDRRPLFGVALNHRF
jgi:hypothetical protein